MNWGGFAGGFAQGFNQTFDAKGLTRYMLSPEYRQARLMSDSMEEAKAEEAQTMVGAAQTNGVAGTAPEPVKTEPVKSEPVQVATTTPAPETPQETVTPGAGARAIAESSTPPVAEKATIVPEPATPPTQATMAQNTGVASAQPQPQKTEQKASTPIETQLQRSQQIYRRKLEAIGDYDTIAKLDAHLDSEKGKKAAALYGKAWNTLTVGNDVNRGVQQLGEYYNKFVDDGVDFVKGEVTKDGQIAITTKRKSDGAENVINMSRGQLLRMGMAYNPVKLFEMNLAEAVDAEKQGAKTRSEIAKEDRTFNRDIEKMTIEKQLDAANVGAKERRAMNTKIEALRAAGYSEDFINRSMPAILGIGDKKATSPDEARRLAYADRLKSDPMFGRKSKEERDRIISEDMGIVFAGGKPSDMPAAPAPATPAAAGLPKAGKGIPVFDVKENKIIYR